MVQDYLPAIDTEGEVDVIFFGGEFSHAVLKQPALHVGEGVVEHAWERMAWAGLTNPSPEQLAVATQTMGFVAQRFGKLLPYARVDLICGAEGDPLLLELELIDPYLSLDMQPTAAASFAEAILRYSTLVPLQMISGRLARLAQHGQQE